MGKLPQEPSGNGYEVVPGRVFARSVPKTIGLLAGCALGFLFGLLLVWAKISDELHGPVPGADQHVTWYGLILGGASVLFMPFIAARLMASLRATQRLVVGEDRLQLVELISGVETVVVQIPFSNLADAKYEATRSHRRVGIDLIDPSAPGTFARGPGFESNKGVFRRHYCITTGYEGGPSAIAAAAISQSYGEWRKRQPATE
jgi:hypothetical protein